MKNVSALLFLVASVIIVGKAKSDSCDLLQGIPLEEDCLRRINPTNDITDTLVEGALAGLCKAVDCVSELVEKLINPLSPTPSCDSIPKELLDADDKCVTDLLGDLKPVYDNLPDTAITTLLKLAVNLICAALDCLLSRGVEIPPIVGDCNDHGCPSPIFGNVVGDILILICKLVGCLLPELGPALDSVGR